VFNPFVKQIAALVVLSILSNPAWACNLLPQERGESVADFVEAISPCVYDLPDTYRIDLVMEAAFLTAINRARAGEGRPALRVRPPLLDAARFQSLDMAANDFFGHEGPNGRFHHDRIAALDRRAVVSFSAENVAKLEVVQGPYDFGGVVERLHKGLMDSPGHRKNILSEQATHIAIGVVRSARGVWVTQVFVRMSGEMPRDVPVRIAPNGRIAGLPKLNNWTAGRLEVRGADNLYKTLPVRAGTYHANAGLNGDYDLVVFGDRPGNRPNTKLFTRLMAPSLTIE